jgi:hypothetical protein
MNAQPHLYTAACCCEDLQPALARQVLGHHHSLGAALVVHLQQMNTGTRAASNTSNML